MATGVWLVKKTPSVGQPASPQLCLVPCVCPATLAVAFAVASGVTGSTVHSSWPGIFGVVVP